MIVYVHGSTTYYFEHSDIADITLHFVPPFLVSTKCALEPRVEFRVNFKHGGQSLYVESRNAKLVCEAVLGVYELIPGVPDCLEMRRSLENRTRKVRDSIKLELKKSEFQQTWWSRFSDHERTWRKDQQGVLSEFLAAFEELLKERM